MRTLAGRLPVPVMVLVLVAGVAACGAQQTPAALISQGLKAQLSGDLSTASSAYQQAIKTDANNSIAHYDLGTVYDKQGNVTQAIAEYRATLVIAPTFADALFNLAVDTTQSDPAGAEQLYLRVISLQPTYAAAWLNVGFILDTEGNVAEAKADWAHAVSLDASLASRLPTPPASEVGTGSAKPSPTPAH
jgi:tetratricopeptide (TPR) repeat protein